MRANIAFGYLLTFTIIATPIAAWSGLLSPWVGLPWGDLPLLGKFVMSWVLFSFFALWFWMLADFFRGRNIKYRFAVGFLLLFANWLAATLYFLLVYARTPRPNQSL